MRAAWRECHMKIEIYDQMYNVNGEQDEEYLKELAAYVDGRMRTIAESTHMVDSLKVAVLAALNIADEMFTMRQKQQQIEGPLRKRVEKCVLLVEKALEQSN
jgi:cell division protein ZapA